MNEMEKFIKENLTKETRKELIGDIEVGDKLVFKNGYGVKLEFNVIGFNYDDDFNKKYNSYIYLDWDCYWYPIGLDRIIKVIKKEKKND